MADGAGVCLLYYKDGEEWAEYVKTELSALGIAVSSIDFEQEYREPTSSSLDVIKKSAILITILTPQLMTFLSEDHDFNKLIQDPPKSIILLLGEPVAVFNDMKISSAFPSFDENVWNVLEYTGNWKIIEVEISQLYESYMAAMSEKIAKEKEKKKLKVDKKPKLEMTITPAYGRCEERTEVVLFFKEPIQEPMIEVFLESVTDQAEVMHLKAVQKMNDYTFKFTAPEHPPGKMHIKAMVQKKTQVQNPKRETTTLRCLSSADFEYYSPMDAVDGLNHILLYIANAALQAVRDNRIELSTLDTSIAKGLFDYDHINISTKGFELLFGQYEYCVSESSSEEIPTLLHLAAKFGLTNLTSKLVDLPGSAFANSIANFYKQQPSQMAAKQGHKDVQDVLERFQEEDREQYEIYTQMAGYATSSNVPGYIRKYYNAIAHTGRHEIAPVEYVDPNDYKNMFSERTEKPQPRSVNSIDVDAEDYTHVPEDLVPPRPEKPASVSTEQTKSQSLPAKGAPKPDTTSTTKSLPRGQQDLIDIMVGYRDKQINIEEVQMQFKQWQVTNDKKTKQTKQKGSGFSLFRSKQTPKPKPDSKTFKKGPGNEPSSQRDSCNSNSSGGSRGSTASDDDVPMRNGSQGRGKNRTSVVSYVQICQEREPNEPPPLPPRLPPRPIRKQTYGQANAPNKPKAVFKR